MDNQRCCENCTNKMVQDEGFGTVALYCDVYEKYVVPTGLCQWYDGPKIWRKKKQNEVD